jgi:phage shock protein PspC (stress-responsive transcriptional regulator)
MICTQCRHELIAGDRYCGACGAPQQQGRASHWQSQKLARSRAQRRIAGVCGGVAEYLGVDVTFVRTAWVVLSIVPGAIIGGIIAYLLAWLVMPERAAVDASVPPSSRLSRSASDRKIAGVCGGLAEYFEVDATPIRLLWVVLAVIPGAFVGGLAVYLIAWVIMPGAAAPTFTAAISTPTETGPLMT